MATSMESERSKDPDERKFTPPRPHSTSGSADGNLDITCALDRGGIDCVTEAACAAAAVGALPQTAGNAVHSLQAAVQPNDQAFQGFNGYSDIHTAAHVTAAAMSSEPAGSGSTPGHSIHRALPVPQRPSGSTVPSNRNRGRQQAPRRSTSGQAASSNGRRSAQPAAQQPSQTFHWSVKQGLMWSRRAVKGIILERPDMLPSRPEAWRVAVAIVLYVLANAYGFVVITSFLFLPAVYLGGSAYFLVGHVMHSMCNGFVPYALGPVVKGTCKLVHTPAATAGAAQVWRLVQPVYGMLQQTGAAFSAWRNGIFAMYALLLQLLATMGIMLNTNSSQTANSQFSNSTSSWASGNGASSSEGMHAQQHATWLSPLQQAMELLAKCISAVAAVPAALLAGLHAVIANVLPSAGQALCADPTATLCPEPPAPVIIMVAPTAQLLPMTLWAVRMLPSALWLCGLVVVVQARAWPRAHAAAEAAVLGLLGLWEGADAAAATATGTTRGGTRGSNGRAAR